MTANNNNNNKKKYVLQNVSHPFIFQDTSRSFNHYLFFMIYLDSTHIPACSSKVDESHNALKTNNKRIAGSRVLVNPSSKITNLKVFNPYSRSF